MLLCNCIIYMFTLYCIRNQVWALEVSSSIILANHSCLCILVTHKITSICTFSSFVAILVKEVISTKL
nr:MAG TPA: hypothetical protein [Bacteriophage sp.]DAH37795.1 MAG TPA: hypothetical protein [Caudoviricetes sp.]